MTQDPAHITNEDPIKKRIARYDYYYDTRTSAWALRKSRKPKAPKARKHALVVRRLIDERGRYVGNVIDIKSERLCDVFLDINDGVENLDLSRSEPQAEPETLFHSYSGLLDRLALEEKKVPREEELILDLKAAINVIEEDQGTKLRDLEKLTAQCEITWDLLWALFTPNILIFNRHQWTEQNRVLLVRQTEYSKRVDGTYYLHVVCDILHDDGVDFGFAREYFEINKYHGARPIVDLEVYPLKYHTDKDTIYARAVELGKAYVQMKMHSYHEISGSAMRAGKPFEKLLTRELVVRMEKFYTSGRVMISPFAFRQYAPDTSYNPQVRRPVSKETLTDDQYAICTPILMGFSFDRKSWGAFAMSRLRDVNWDDDAFRALVLGATQKRLIHALVREHAAQPERFDDVIQGKGRGLIGLLAGTPGCGKTLTAEAVAETTRKPLYTVSAGQLGTTPETVEERLVRALELAQMWGAVLLLDEAEVFLQQRSVADMARNALVSIFLRQLEYYQGILILTTNMPEQCDAAFESRIHFSVNYPKLDFAARRTVWANFLHRASMEFGDAELDCLASRDINGRQIKNVFSSALTISRANGSQRLLMEDVDVVLSVFSDWQLATQKHHSDDVGVVAPCVLQSS